MGVSRILHAYWGLSGMTPELDLEEEPKTEPGLETHRLKMSEGRGFHEAVI